MAHRDAKIAGKKIVSPEPVEVTESGQVIDLMDALRASLSQKGAPARKPGKRSSTPAEPTPVRRTAKKSR